MKSYNHKQTDYYHYYQIEIITWNHMIVYKLLVLGILETIQLIIGK